MITITFLFLSIAVVCELIEDYIQIVKKKKTDDHTNDMFMRGLLILIGAILDSLVQVHTLSILHIFQATILGMAWFWLTFDYTLNLLIKRPLPSLGTSSWLDRKIRELPWPLVLFAKIWAFGVGVGVYYYWDLIVHGVQKQLPW